MMELLITGSDKKPAYLHLDLKDPAYRALSRFANRIDKLLSVHAVKGNPHAIATLDDFLGVIYALIFARYGEFEDRTKHSIEVGAVQRRAAQVAKGQVRLDGKWMAGFHFNSSLLRAAAVYHRILQVVVDRPVSKEKEYVPTLRPEARKLYRGWKGVEWSSQNVDAVHNEVIGLKHIPKGIYYRRKVKYNHAVSSVGELLELFEAWADS